MARRPSAHTLSSTAALTASISVSTSTTRRVHESTHGFVGIHPTNAGPSAFTPVANLATPQSKVVLALIKRLIAKLPVYSGISLTDLEADNAILNIIETLVDFAKHALDSIIWKISEELEKLTKLDTTGQQALDVLQSELFLLKVMSVTLSCQWQRRNKPDKTHSSIDKGTESVSTLTPSSSQTSLPRSASMSDSRWSIPTLSVEAPPLDEQCAKWVVSIIIYLLRQAQPRDDRTLAYSNLSSDVTLYGFESINSEDGLRHTDDMPWIPSSAIETTNGNQPYKAASLVSSSSSSSTPIPLARSALGFQRTPRTLTMSPIPLHSLITEWAGKIIYLLSAVNWGAVLSRIRGKIHALATQEENQDFIDLQLMQHCAMDRSRLTIILQDLSSLLVNLRPEAQLAVATNLRRAIWGWIETFPAEFAESSAGQRRLDASAPERVFDLFFQIKTEQNRKTIWPTLTALLLLSHDRLKTVAKAVEEHSWGNKTVQNKKELLFADKLRRHVSEVSKTGECAMLCLSDMLRAAMLIPPNKEAPIRNIAPDIAEDLRMRLLRAENQRPFYESTTVREPIDVSLHADILVGLVRFAPEDVYVALFELCLEPERSDAVKLVAVKALIILAQQAAKWPFLSALRTPRLVQRIMSLCTNGAISQSETDELLGSVKQANTQPTLKRNGPEAITDRELLILGILCLYRFDALYIPINDKIEKREVWMADIVQIVRRPGDMAIPLSSLRTFAHAANWMFQLQPGDEYYECGRYWVMLSVPLTIHAAACRLIDCRNSTFEQRIIIEMLYTYLQTHRRCIEMGMIGETWDYSCGRIPSVVIAEGALLVSLTSPDVTVSSMAARGLREIAIAECLPNPRRTIEEPDEQAKRYPMYEQLGDPSVIVIGRVAQQKRIRKLLRMISGAFSLHGTVWYECYWRWAALKDWITRPSSDIENDIKSKMRPAGDLGMTHEEKFFYWQNLTWFLASFGAMSVLEEYSGRTMRVILSIEDLPDRFRIPQDGEMMLQDFLTSTVEFLVSETALARDTAKEALGSELNPRMYSRLFRHLNEVVEDVREGLSRSKESAPSPEEEQFLLVFFEQFLTVLKLLVERSDSPSEELLTNSDLCETLLALTKFMDRFADIDLLRFKVKFCNFCEAVCLRSNSFVLRSDDFLRNNLLDVIVEWFEIEGPGHDDFRLMRLRQEANIAALRTMVRLLERLRLQPLDSSSGDDATHAVSRRYLRLQNVLLQGLSLDPYESSGDEDRSSQHSSARKWRKELGLRDFVISGLAYLLSMNTDIGLKHFLTLGYDSNPARRTIFCKVISRVMDLGGRLETQSDSIVAGRRVRIGELVKGCDMTLVLAICETCPAAEVDVILPVLLNLFDTRTSLLELLKLLIEREVKITKSQLGLFRSNSMRIKLVCAWARTHGYDYLRQIIKPLLDKMCSLVVSQQCSFILDPAKASEKEVKENQDIIELLTGAFLQIVCTSANAMPLMLREVCAHISKVVAEIWVEAKFTALGAFIFLRFISPALVSPETIDIDLPQDAQTIRRGLLVITKIIQNIANNVRFGKEAHMICFNAFLEKNIVGVMRFLTDINKQVPTTEEEIDEWRGGFFDETDAIVLHRFFEKHADKVGKELLSLHKTSKEGEASVVGGKKAWDTLCASLVEMGQPVEIPRLSPLHSTALDIYRNFMVRNADRSTDSVRGLFTEISTKGNVSIYVLALCNFDIEVLDFELLVYHIFKTLMSTAAERKAFELIVDCTNYTTASEIPMQWFKFFLELTPSDLRSRFLCAYILNCNWPMSRFLRKLYNICSGIFSVEIKPKLSVSELCAAIDCDVKYAIDTAWTLEQEEKETFRNVMLRQVHLVKVPADLSVAQSHIRIDSIKAQNIYGQFSCKTTEIVPFTDIGDIYNVSTGRDAHEFIIRRNRNGGTLYFSSPERDQIIKAIRSAKSRMNTSRTVFFDRFSRLSNISAALLNIAMFNMHSELPDLRSSAYDLLISVCSSINYNEETLLPSTGGLVPGRPSVISGRLSQKLAAFAPELTLDFISQVCVELERAPGPQKSICFLYMLPWLKNLNFFCDPTNKLYELSGARLRDCIRLLLDLTVRDPSAFAIARNKVWPEMGKLDSAVVNVIIDEIMRAAVDGGIGSTRCEIMAEVLSTMCSRNSRGRILSKLRKALGKASTKPSKTLDKNVHWNEIAAYSRLALGTGQATEHVLQVQLLVPEILHLVTLLASQGDATMRNTIYGLTVQLFQALYYVHTDDANLSSDVRSLIAELSNAQTIRLFGLSHTSYSNELVALEKQNERETLEGLTHWLLKAIAICSGNTGLANIWRARWMGLLTATAFQLSPSIQPRAFVVMGTLASSDVDDDLLYQMLVALRSALRSGDETDPQCAVSMLNCISKVVPSLQDNSRYTGPLFWLAVALLQTGHAAFYCEACGLLCACLTTLTKQGAFDENGFNVTLLEARASLEDISLQMDQMLYLSFDSDFSFSLAPVIFKGIRRPQFRESAINVLRCLLTTATNTLPPPTEESTIPSEVLGYFLALLPVSTNLQSYRQLLQEARVGAKWIPKKDEFTRAEERDRVPHVPFELLGCYQPTPALLATSFVGSILTTAQVDDVESQILFVLLKDAALLYPEIVALVQDSLSEKIQEVFSSTTNPTVLSAASSVFRVSMEDGGRVSSVKGSQSTLNTLDEEAALGQKQLHALEEHNMQGLANDFVFLPANRGDAATVLKWFPELITKIIE